MPVLQSVIVYGPMESPFRENIPHRIPKTTKVILSTEKFETGFSFDVFRIFVSNSNIRIRKNNEIYEKSCPGETFPKIVNNFFFHSKKSFSKILTSKKIFRR
jgi:hypothetical protein